VRQHPLEVRTPLRLSDGGRTAGRHRSESVAAAERLHGDAGLGRAGPGARTRQHGLRRGLRRAGVAPITAAGHRRRDVGAAVRRRRP